MKKILTLFIVISLSMCGCGDKSSNIKKDLEISGNVLNDKSDGNITDVEKECVNYLKNYFCMIVNFMYLNEESDKYECMLYYDYDTDSIKYEEVLYDDYVDTLLQLVDKMYGSNSEEWSNLEEVAEFEVVGRDMKISACEQLVNGVRVKYVDGNNVSIYSGDDIINLEYNQSTGKVIWV